MHKMMQILVPLMLAVAMPSVHAGEQKVYKWTDNNGVTHYTQAPPPKGSTYEATSMREPRPARNDAVAEPEVELSPLCKKVRANLDILNSAKVVTMDTDGDGESETLSDEQRQTQVSLAEQQWEAYCE
ncbi:MAG: DUF4124 domain-containing protein [Xanthomonadales bacterium]|nr:DUF4124 domain-containing protein [Xanthomonadales bacterium]